MDLGRNLLGSEVMQELILVNAGLLSLHWSLDGELPQQLTVLPQTGDIGPGKRQVLTIQADTATEWVLDHALAVKANTHNLLL